MCVLIHSDCSISLRVVDKGNDITLSQLNIQSIKGVVGLAVCECTTFYQPTLDRFNFIQ